MGGHRVDNFLTLDQWVMLLVYVALVWRHLLLLRKHRALVQAIARVLEATERHGFLKTHVTPDGVLHVLLRNRAKKDGGEK